MDFPIPQPLSDVYTKSACTRQGDKDRNGKIGLKYLRNVENENACEPLMISLFKIVPAK